MPYITASIIMELLATTFPALGKMKKREMVCKNIYKSSDIQQLLLH